MQFILVALAWWVCSEGRAGELLGPAALSYPAWPPGATSQYCWPFCGLAAADFDSDGILDLAVTSGRNLDLHLGDGRGGFSLASEWDAGPYPESMAVGDFNNDGAADLAVSNRVYAWFTGETGTVSILLGDGHGGFTRSPDLQVGLEPSFIGVGDLNLDGALDLTVTNSYEGYISIFLGDGLGDFAHSMDLPALNLDVDHPGTVLIDDFTLDGKPDVLVGGLGAAKLFAGDGNGSFSDAIDLSVGGDPIVEGDFNSDGVQDLAAAQFESNIVVIALGNGHGDFNEVIQLETGGWPVAMAAGDFNDDGAEDLAVASNSPDALSVFIGDGRGSFAKTAEIIVGTGAVSLAAGDVNSDGVMDLVVLGFDSETFTVFVGDGLGGFSRTVDLLQGPFPGSLGTADFNGDGTADLAVLNIGDMNSEPQRPRNVSVMLGDGAGGFSESVRLPLEFSGYGYRRELEVADFNGDRIPDLVVTSPGLQDPYRSISIPGDIKIYLGDGRGGFARATDLLVGKRPLSAVSGDFNGDGQADLAVALSEYAGSFPSLTRMGISIHLGDGAGGFAPLPLHLLDFEPHAIVLGDFNGDHIADLAVSSWGGGAMELLLGDGTGSFSTSCRMPVSGADMASGDFNRDGHLDLVLVSRQTTHVSVLLGDGMGGLREGSRYGGSGDFVLAGDFNGDGIGDLVVSRSLADGVSVLVGDGDGKFLQMADLSVGVYPNSMVSGDFNGDGALDVVVAKFGSDSVSVLLNGTPTRADVNGTNRVDGFDVNEIGRLAGCRIEMSSGIPDSCYRRSVDANADGFIDGGDLDLVASRFGESIRSRSWLVARPESTPSAPQINTVTFGPMSSTGDVLSVPILVNDADDRAAGADFGVTYDQSVLSYAGMTAGTYLAGQGAFLIYNVDDRSANRIGIRMVRFPNRGRIGTGTEALMYLLFRARARGRTAVEFSAFERAEPTFLDESGHELPGIEFMGSLSVDVSPPAGTFSGQRISVSPSQLDFGRVEVGEHRQRRLRISNLGISDLIARIGDVPSPVKEFRPFVEGEFTIAPASMVEVPVEYESTGAGIVNADLVVESNDPSSPRVLVPMRGSSGLAMSVRPSRLDFGGVPLGISKTASVVLSNGSDRAMILTGVVSSDPQFLFRADFPALTPGESGNLDVTFEPVRDAESGGFLTLSFSAPDASTVVLNLVGRGGPDSDNDGIIDSLDRCPGDRQNDADRDGVCGNLDNCPSVTNRGQLDSDGDGGGDACDNCPAVANPDQRDTDMDSIGDACDPCPHDPVNDEDGDGFCVGVLFNPPKVGGNDNCPTMPNPDQADGDHDGRGDVCDSCPLDLLNDGDDDGFCVGALFNAPKVGGNDNCPAVYNPGQTNNDSDGLGDACDPCPFSPLNDVDGDGRCGDVDNCAAVWNPDQADADHDSLGDVCDPCPLDPLNDGDDDRFCVGAVFNAPKVGGNDNCPTVANADQADADHDGVGDLCDNCPDTYNPGQEDGNGDGAGDACQPVVEIFGIQQDGGPELEVTVRLTDPDGDLLNGRVRILDPREYFALGEYLTDSPACSLELPPESLSGVGVAFTIGPALFDPNSMSICHNGGQDYELAPGPCAAPEGAFFWLMDLAGVSVPQAICIRRFDHSADFDYTVVSLDADTVVLQGANYVISETSYQESTLPVAISLSSLVPGNTYQIEITTTDGKTPPVTSRVEFLYQGEGTIRFLSP